LAPQPSLGPGLLHKIQLNFLEASQQFSFLQGRVVSPTLNPHPGGLGLCIYILQRQGGSHLRLIIPSDLFSSGFPTKILYAFLISMRGAMPPFT
jgi:hypothetical protein